MLLILFCGIFLDFGLVKLHRDGSVFFGHNATQAPLMHDKLTLDSSGKLFLETVKTNAVHIKSKQAQLCEALVTNQLQVDHEVINSGGLKTKQLLGQGNFLNEARVEFTGTPEDPALIGIKDFINRQTVTADAARITSDNESFQNKKNALCEIAWLVLDKAHWKIKSIFFNKGSLKSKELDINRDVMNEGFLQTDAMKLGIAHKFINEEFGHVKVLKKCDALLASIINKGTFDIQGHNTRLASTSLINKGDFTVRSFDVCSGEIDNQGAMRMKNGDLNYYQTKLQNNGTWFMDNMEHSRAYGHTSLEKSIDIENNGTLELKDCKLNFNNLTNNKNLICKSGIYGFNTLHNHYLIQLLGNDWAITRDSNNVRKLSHIAHMPNIIGLHVDSPNTVLGNVECEKNLYYGSVQTPHNTTEKYTIDELMHVKTPQKVTAHCNPTVVDKEIEFDIGHLELYAPALTVYGDLKAPKLTLHVDGPLIVGKDNAHLGTVAATHGPLIGDAHGIDGRYGKFYGNGDSVLESTQGDIAIGAEAYGIDPAIQEQFKNHVHDHTLGVPNGAYAFANGNLTLKSAVNILIRFGAVMSALNNKFIAEKEIENISSRIAANDGSIFIQGDNYIHGRKDTVIKGITHYWGSRGRNTYTWHTGYPGSVPAQLETLHNINFFLNKKVRNIAGIMLAGTGIYFNGEDLKRVKGTSYIEEPQTFNQTLYTDGAAWNGTNLLFTQSCITRAAKKININMGDFVITGNMHTGKIKIHGNTGLFTNNSRTRNTLNPTQPTVVDVTDFITKQIEQRSGFYRVGANSCIETEFPLGLPSCPQEGDLVLLKNQEQQVHLNWKTILNPLKSINFDLYLQQLLSQVTGTVCAGTAKGNKLAKVLWSNANDWRKEHGTEEMSLDDVQQLKRSMLLAQVVRHGGTEQQHTLLCIAPHDINPYQDQGDIVADTFECHTEGDQKHHNNRIVAKGPEGIIITSKTGDTNFETEKYTVEHAIKKGKVTQDVAMPQQQLLAQKGPIKINAHNNVNRTGTAMAAAGDIDEHAEIGSVNKNPLLLQTTTETHKKKRGMFSSTKKVETNTTHQAVPSSTIAGTTLHDKAGTTIQGVASHDSAGEKIVYESPNTNIEGMIVANRTVKQSTTKSTFSQQSSCESKETPYAVPAHIQAPVIQLKGERARINACVQGELLLDDTEQGAEFVAKVAQMLCSGQTLVSSPFMKVDAGYNAMYETMIPPMLMVEKIIRAKDTGHMLFQSAIIDKNRTEIVGKCVEIAYQLKQSQQSWCRKSQLISDEIVGVIAFAIVLATQGMAVELFAPLLQSITAATGLELSAAGVAMFNAGFSTICSNMGAAVVHTGDPLQAMEKLGSSESLKALIFSMGSAGLCAELGSRLKINMKPELKSLTDHVCEHTLRNTVDALLNVAIHHVPVDKAFIDAGKQIPLKTVAAYAAQKICTLYTDKVVRQTTHSVLGGLAGFAMKHNSEGFVSGAVGALTAEIVGDILVSDAQEVCNAACARLSKTGKPFTTENIQQAIDREIQVRTYFAKVAAGGVAVVIHQKSSIALMTGSNAIDNDVAIRGTLYAHEEFQKMVNAASQAFVVFSADEKHEESKGYIDKVLEAFLKDIHEGIERVKEANRKRYEKKQEKSKDVAETRCEKKSFVRDQKAGRWVSACFADDILLDKEDDDGRKMYILHRSNWKKDPNCPFVVSAHGSSLTVTVENQDIHPQGLSETNKLILQEEEKIRLCASELAHLIKTAPNYKERQHIHLHTCDGGKDDEGIAQKLADIMKVSVSAFTGILMMDRSRFFSVADANKSRFDDSNLKEIKTFYPREAREAMPPYGWHGIHPDHYPF